MRGYRYIAAVLMAAGAVGLMNGCGSAKKASDGASSVSTAENRMEESSSAAREEKNAKAALPAYEYPGPELYYTVLYDYMAKELGQYFDAADVGIPCPVIIYEDESNKEDIRVYGDFQFYNYSLDGDTLKTESGGSFPGCIHIKSTDRGYEVTGFDRVEDGSGFTASAKKIFGSHYDAYISRDEKEAEKTRAQIIANYVAANGLAITQYQDYGWDPVKLPEENIDSFYSNLDG
ncbi:hypothetical protein ACTQ56_08730 [[Clostridium] aminophilum]|uniref:hypothetical protein n=1 Tax=[Clostridium] aminophilum TaxID=1526 RepID=UPI0026F0DDE8|nr:hypothetical protein [[Clostridium] aminophilum]MDD6195323.1 hypothetical protein [[Clostridium] aminophilum]